MKDIKNKIIGTLSLDSTYDHLTSLFGDDVTQYIDWVCDNLIRLDLTGYDLERLKLIKSGDADALLGLVEDMFGMYLMNLTKWNDYEIISK